MGYSFIKIAVWLFCISVMGGIMASNVPAMTPLGPGNETVPYQYYQDINQTLGVFNATEAEAEAAAYTQGSWVWGLQAGFTNLGLFAKAVAMPGTIMNDAGFPSFIGNGINVIVGVMYFLAIVQFVSNRKME